MSQPTPAPPSAAKPVALSKLMDLIPKQVTAADCLSIGTVDAMWNNLYREAGVHTGGEDKKMSLRLWVYITCAINGTSRVGEYAGTDVLADGTSVEVAIIPRVCGRDIRKFLRSNMRESTKFLKETGALEHYPRYVAKAISNGGNATNAWAMCDWMDNNPEFSPAERNLHETVYRNGIARARIVRNGLSLEEVEGQGRTKVIHANGADVHDLGRGEIVDF